MKNSKTIQDKIAELDKLVAWFDSNDFTLEKALSQFKKAEKLAAEIEHDLTSLKNDIQIVKKRFDQTTNKL
jgi:exodeoxyribonuclease VII small subunit